MWLCLVQGFFSLVRNSQGPGKVLRARCVSHMTRVKHAYKGFHRLPIIHTTDSDYPYRIVITDRQAEEFMLWAVNQVTYVNFKDAVSDNTQDPRNPYLAFLHEVWALSRQWLQVQRRVVARANPQSGKKEKKHQE
jgi:hypothetical protein